MSAYRDRHDQPAGLNSVRMLLSVLLWLGLSLCSLQLARIDLPDPQTRIDRAVTGRGTVKIATAARLDKEPQHSATSGPPPIVALLGVGMLILLFAMTGPRAAPAWPARASVRAGRWTLQGFSARAPPRG